MKELIKSVKDFKIIPQNFKSAGTFDVVNVLDNEIEIKLNLLDAKELNDYKVGSSVEVFGTNNIGLIYFETKITSINDNIAKIAIVDDYSIIQRREYSRVGINNGTVVFSDLAPDFIENIEDISAGGLKFVAKAPLEEEKYYKITITLSGNMVIECEFQPIRIIKNENNYTISGKFINLENMDRVVLVQYAFKIKMESQNKNNDII